MTTVTITVNGKAETRTISANRLLVEFLREELRLTGTHIGCDTSQCGACVVHVNGRSVKSCAMLAVEADGAQVTTIEGLGGADEADWHPLQTAFKECHGLQCGFCTPGMIMSAAELLTVNNHPDEDEIRHWLEGNICRCTGYQNIIASIQRAGVLMREKAHV